MKSRRDALFTLAAGALAPSLQGQHQHSDALFQMAKPAPPKTITGDDFKLLGQLVDLIIPRTATPGASDAGVPLYIDRLAGSRPSLAPQLRAGLGQIRAAGFVDALPDRQVEQLKAMEAAADPFFT